jgi:16S rRNA (guanine527-N7)-methyltransferase
METLTTAAAAFGVTLSDAQTALLERYRSGVLEWNEKINLTAITDPKDFEIKHLLDSLSALQAIPAEAKSLVDVGTGAGFPGVPIKIARPDLAVTLIEAVGKKAGVIDHLVKDLALENCEVVNARAEEAGRHPDYREKFDVAIARAVAHLPILLEYMLPLVRVGGIAVVMKVATEGEVASAENALAELGGSIVNTIPVELPGAPLRHLIIVKKTTNTTDRYPRAAGVPAQRPL